jgi:hypothetical protein
LEPKKLGKVNASDKYQPGSNLTIASYNACVVKIHNAEKSAARFKNLSILHTLKTL